MSSAQSEKYNLLDQLAEEFAERFRRGECPALSESQCAAHDRWIAVLRFTRRPCHVNQKHKVKLRAAGARALADALSLPGLSRLIWKEPAWAILARRFWPARHASHLQSLTWVKKYVFRTDNTMLLTVRFDFFQKRAPRDNGAHQEFRSGLGPGTWPHAVEATAAFSRLLGLVLCSFQPRRTLSAHRP
jgi:hypothetical protein